MTGLRIVPSVATEEMELARRSAPNCLAEYAAMLAAAPAMTDEQIDALCRAMWPDHYLWKPNCATGRMADHDREDYRVRMRAFIHAITNGA